MSPYKKEGGFRGGDRPHFKKSFGGAKGGFSRGSRDFDGPRQMYTATCANCGRTTEVPFRPTGERPVYCKDCFDKQAPQGRFDRREAPRQFERREAPRITAPAGNDRAIEELKSQIMGMNRKLDTAVSLLAEVAASLQQQPTQNSNGLGDVVKKVAKKAAKKKKEE
jgi:CxxC-x17-CxxC domain-containing protein